MAALLLSFRNDDAEPLTPDDDVELLNHCLGRHETFDRWDGYRDDDRLHIHVPGSNPPTTADVPEKLASYVHQEAITEILCWGANAASLRTTWPKLPLSGMRFDHKWNRLLRIRFADYRPDPGDRQWGRARSIARRGVQFEPSSICAVPLQAHLLASLQCRILNPLQARIYASFELLAGSPDTLTFSAVHEGTIVGVMALRLLTPLHAYTCWSAVTPTIPHLTDFLYAQTIQAAAKRFTLLDLGYGVNEGIFRYKEKWRPTNILPPRAYVRFGKKEETVPHTP